LSPKIRLLVLLFTASSNPLKYTIKLELLYTGHPKTRIKFIPGRFFFEQDFAMILGECCSMVAQKNPKTGQSAIAPQKPKPLQPFDNAGIGLIVFLAIGLQFTL
jgi:hypothetical protein